MIRPLARIGAQADRWELAAIAVVILGCALRVARLDLMEFKGDEQEALNLGIRLLADQPWATDAPWPRHGMLSSNNVANAPLFNWLMAAAWWLTSHPVRATALVGLLNGVSLYPLWRWAAARLDRERAFLLLSIAAVSPFAVLLSRKLWAQDLLFPALVCLLWAIEWWQRQKTFHAIVVFGIAALFVGQLHQSGLIALALFPLAVVLQHVLGGRRFLTRVSLTRLAPWQYGVLLVLLIVHAFFWLPYLSYLVTVPPEVFASRPRLATYQPELLLRVLYQVLPIDFFYFFGPDRADFLADPLRRAAYYLAVAFGTPLGAFGLWRWARSPFGLPVAGIWWWLVVAAFTVARIPTYPFYVLVLSPLPAALAAGAFDGSKRRSPLFERTLLAWRWTYVAALLLLTLTSGEWLAARGGSRGDYGVTYGIREQQARALATAEGTSSDGIDHQRLRCEAPPGEVRWIIEHVLRVPAPDPDARICAGWMNYQRGMTYVWVVSP